ncbi:helix-turn-helix transcriptional regulator [Photobacterium sp. BZF1]|uniref:helix-turn-helix domain-containing protein n=1 Tax=Photobacterium sp. BZF1 TaxID=1904457 RepID=UPI001653A88D|nr:helix-turn-helix transcriptional regulator [Photobacterium sp. BZF1]MBC7001108.1 helix-turn-helix transcriptional regulator [Photobacterium sp. BZF1]
MSTYQMPNMETFGARIKHLRINAGYKSQPELCRSINIPLTTWAKYENGYRFPKLDSIVTIANFFNVSPLWIVGITDNPDNVEVRPYPEDGTDGQLMPGVLNGKFISNNGDIYEITSRLIERGRR